jgi:hypothetical protein
MGEKLLLLGVAATTVIGVVFILGRIFAWF